jgi:hypothetical protein
LESAVFTVSFEGVADRIQQIVGFVRFSSCFQVPRFFAFVLERIGFKLNFAALYPYKVKVVISAIANKFTTFKRVFLILPIGSFHKKETQKNRQESNCR